MPRRKWCRRKISPPQPAERLAAFVPALYRTASAGLRSVAQPGSAPRSGRGGRRFESCHSDQRFQSLINGGCSRMGRGTLFTPRLVYAPIAKKCTPRASVAGHNQWAWLRSLAAPARGIQNRAGSGLRGIFPHPRFSSSPKEMADFDGLAPQAAPWRAASPPLIAWWRRRTRGTGSGGRWRSSRTPPKNP